MNDSHRSLAVGPSLFLIEFDLNTLRELLGSYLWNAPSSGDLKQVQREKQIAFLLEARYTISMIREALNFLRNEKSILDEMIALAGASDNAMDEMKRWASIKPLLSKDSHPKKNTPEAKFNSLLGNIRNNVGFHYPSSKNAREIIRDQSYSAEEIVDEYHAIIESLVEGYEAQADITEVRNVIVMFRPVLLECIRELITAWRVVHLGSSS